MSPVLKTLDIEPCFDLEMFLSVSQEKRVGGELLERIAGLWEEWKPHAHAASFECEGQGYLLVWLGDAVDEAVDSTWDTRPSEAFLLNALAQVMCMSLVYSVVPKVEMAGCAAAPNPSPALGEILAGAGVPYSNGGPTLSRHFAVLTYNPFKGGCEVCSLQKNCPKGSGAQSMSVELPGYQL